MKLSKVVQVLLPLLLLAGAAAFIFAVRGALLPFILSILLAHSANPFLKRLELNGLRRGLAIVLLYLGIVVLFGTLGHFGISALKTEVADLRTRVPEYVHTKLPELRTMKVGPLEVGSKVVDYVQQHQEEWGAEIVKAVPELTTIFLEIAGYSLLILIVSPFIMASAPQVLEAVVDACPSRHAERLLNLLWALDETIGRYIRGLILEASLVGLVTLIGLLAIHMQYAVWLSLLVAACNVVPVYGLIAGAATTGLFALVLMGPVGMAQAAVVFAVAKMADDFVFQPMIMGRAVHIHLVVLLFALECGGKLGGLLGVVFAVPVACIIRLLLATGFEWYKTEFGLETREELVCVTVADPPLL